MYDYLIVGAGLYGSICAEHLVRKGKSVLVVDKRSHIGGNCYSERRNGIDVHIYGPHIFHTNDEDVWSWVTSKIKMNDFTLRPVANYKGELFSLPFNMWTFNQMWGVITPDEAKEKIDASRIKKKRPSNLEEQAISLVGEEVYKKLIKGYTEKQWQRNSSELPPSIIRRLPVRFTYDNNYFNDRFQGIPVEGYTKLFEVLLSGVEVKLNTDFFDKAFNVEYKNLIYTGPIDKFYEYRYGKLEYRSTEFSHERLENTDNFQGVAMMNYTDINVPYTRIVEHKHFVPERKSQGTWITKEYPLEINKEGEPLYPINDRRNTETYKKYKKLADAENSVHFGGRLGNYKYFDMHQVIASALKYCKSI